MPSYAREMHSHSLLSSGARNKGPFTGLAHVRSWYIFSLIAELMADFPLRSQGFWVINGPLTFVLKSGFWLGLNSKADGFSSPYGLVGMIHNVSWHHVFCKVNLIRSVFEITVGLNPSKSTADVGLLHPSPAGRSSCASQCRCVGKAPNSCA